MLPGDEIVDTDDLIGVYDLADFLSQEIGADNTGAAESVELAQALVRSYTRRPTLAQDSDDGFPTGDPSLVIARGIALRVAARLLTNPLQRSGYSSAAGSFQTGPDFTARLLTPDERRALDPFVDYAAGGVLA